MTNMSHLQARMRGNLLELWLLLLLYMSLGGPMYGFPLGGLALSRLASSLLSLPSIVLSLGRVNQI